MQSLTSATDLKKGIYLLENTSSDKRLALSLMLSRHSNNVPPLFCKGTSLNPKKNQKVGRRLIGFDHRLSSSFKAGRGSCSLTSASPCRPAKATPSAFCRREQAAAHYHTLIPLIVLLCLPLSYTVFFSSIGTRIMMFSLFHPAVS